MKKIHRFLINSQISENTTISDIETIHLIKNVLKLKIGEECIVFNDKGDDHIVEILSIDKNKIEVKKRSIIPKKTIPKTAIACISIIKKDNFELIVQKLTEIGVREITPIYSQRSKKQDIKIERLQKISDEALEQSGGSDRIKINKLLTLKECLDQYQNITQYYFDIDGENTIKNNQQNFTFYIGPEGGWSDGDKELFKEYKLQNIKLTDTVLRSETAAIIGAHTLLWN
jgi:16S rRNA (uracil1498-N3)-methyltransferase